MTNLLLNPSINIFGIDIYYYAIIIVTGMILAIILMAKLFKKLKMRVEDLFDYVIVILPLSLLGARLYFFMFPYEGTTSNWANFFQFRNGGMGFYGGIIGGIIGAAIVCFFKKQHFLKIADAAAPGIILAQSIGRWGNFVNQEAFGFIVTDPKLQFFPFAVFIDNINEWHLATFFYESVWNLVGFAIIMLLFYKVYKKGMPFMVYIGYYGLGRLWIEELRTDSLFLKIGTWNTGIKISMLVSVIMIIISIVGLCIIYKKEIKKLWYKLNKRPWIEIYPDEPVYKIEKIDFTSRNNHNDDK